MHDTTELLTADKTDLHSQIMNLRCSPIGLVGGSHESGYQLGHRNARHAAAELVAAHIPGGMTRDQAFELLEVHFGPRASLSIHEEANRYFLASCTGRQEQVVNWVVYVRRTDLEFSFTRDTLSESVAAAVSSVEAYKEQA